MVRATIQPPKATMTVAPMTRATIHARGRLPLPTFETVRDRPYVRPMTSANR